MCPTTPVFFNTSISTVVCCRCHQVGQSVIARFKDGKYYGAFISRVNADGTYLVYYVDDSITLDYVEHKEIKKPLRTDRQKNFAHWSNYRDKVFFEEGQFDDSDSDEEYFEPGHFCVKTVVWDY